jgi:quercetin 2,3-dioxygenase
LHAVDDRVDPAIFYSHCLEGHVAKSTRRENLKLLAAAGATATVATGTPGCAKPSPGGTGSAKSSPAAPGATSAPLGAKANTTATPTPDAVLSTAPLGVLWKVADPFIFCAHHDDRYPAGNDHMGPSASLAGRNMGQDFEGKDGWRMYHGEVVPGFPQHPHRGFETVTVVRSGLLDHSDSLGATARYGGGDVQWLTAGNGIQHAEMFPLIERQEPNPLELFQIWLNLPAADKMVAPYFSMFWNKSIPRHKERDSSGRATEITIVAGRYGQITPPIPPPHSWAARPDSDVAIWTIKLDPGARFTLPAARPGTNRSLYFFRGSGLRVDGAAIANQHQIVLRGDRTLTLHAGAEDRSEQVELLLLQGRPIGEPVVQYGPFVMNTDDEIRQAFADYRTTQFGGWPWRTPDPVHARDKGRFALHTDGRLDRPA